MLEGDFALCISLYHGYELLMQMGLRSLFFYIQGIIDGSREMSRARNELQRTPTFIDLYNEMKGMFVKPSAGPDEPFVYSHPKLEKLEGVVLQHFIQWAESSAHNDALGAESTRVMIFSSFRESVQEIADMLNRQAPMIKVMTFMGQASAGKGVKGFTQKEQLEVVHRFRQGGFNTLVSTCVGEEGLDIGEVDLIVCFDAQKSPIRLVQRMGRTGRKRQGRIVVILAEGREERTYNQSQSNKRSVHKSITGNHSGFHMYPNSPRMLPDGVHPTLHKMHITCGQFDHKESSRASVGGRRSHCERQTSLIHPQNLFRQSRTTSDGFLSSAEYSLWASTMRLQDDEAHPTLKQSHFLSIPSDVPPQEERDNSGAPSRVLSLWEWRHWQHKVLPTHVVDHSLRCRHFIQVMELVDGMKEENEGECHYEQELLPYLHNANTGGDMRKRQKKQKSVKTSVKKPKPSHSTSSDLECLEEVESNFTDPPGLDAVCPLPSTNDCPEADLDDDCVIIKEGVINSDISSQLSANVDEEDVELEAMFYLPKWDSAPPASSAELLPGPCESLKVILANVAELLSRPPSLPPAELEADVAALSLPPSHQQLHQPFHVSFTLDIDDDEDEMMMSDADDADNASPRTVSFQHPTGEEDSKNCIDPPHQEERPVREAASSPTWDEVFGEEEDNMEADEEMNNNFKKQQIGEEAEKSRDIINNSGNTSEEKVSWEHVRTEETPHSTVGGVSVDGASRCSPHMDDSLDLFGDDEAFLQMTIPDIPTPGVTPRRSTSSGDVSDSKERKSDASQMQNTTDLFSTVATGNSRQRLHTMQTDDLECTKHVTHTPHDKQKTHDAAACNNTDKIISAHCKSPTVQQNAESCDGSHDYFSVNFDLGYSMEDSEDEADVEAVPASCRLSSPEPKQQAADSPASLRTVSNSSTPYNSFTAQRIPAQCRESKLSTPRRFSMQRQREMSPLLTFKSGALPSPIPSLGARRTLVPGPFRPQATSLLSSSKHGRPEGCTAEFRGGSGAENKSFQESILVSDSPPHPEGSNSDSEDEVVVLKRRHQNVFHNLSSPEVSKISDVDSPVVVNRKRAAPLNTSSEAEGEAASDDDFQSENVFARRTPAQGGERKRVRRAEAKQAACRKGRQFLQEEAELSGDEEGADVSSDEEDGEDQNQSLDGFVVDNTHFSQGLNDSEMHGVYLKSVRSPAMHGKFKMSYRTHRTDIFSQVPEQDETYAEDSFVVGSEVEEVESSEEEAEDVQLMPEDSYVDGKRQYATRRRVLLHNVRARARPGGKTAAAASSEQTAEEKTKRSRIIRVNDSSDEETGEVSRERLTAGGSVAVTSRQKAAQPEASRHHHHQQKASSSSSSATIASKVSLLSKGRRSSESEEQLNERCRQRLENQHLLSDELDFENSVLTSKNPPKAPPSTSSAPQPRGAASVSEAPAAPGSVCILVDSRCISTGVELMTSLRQRHAATVHVCSLDGSYFIVSNRMAVERHSQSDLSAVQNRKRLVERVNSLLGLFERVCLIVEKDRSKPGEASRPFQRTRFYDGTLAGLVGTGVRLLWSAGAEESAGLLADLARLEQRKGQGISVPLEVRGQHKQQALQLYLSLPSVSFVHALNMSHNFSSVAQLMNSSMEAIQKGGCMSTSRAEEIYRFLRYPCDTFLMNASKAGKNS
ncbi:Fanconi anemia group M protein [Limanda limanda]|uniref:Fanconi anemia group M protein n=1 Tax=Limanda limanda TaxID=27771 RepID=UPI0029C67CDD|nr:Fanconi anemia group M protein [Limanda limanda]